MKNAKVHTVGGAAVRMPQFPVEFELVLACCACSISPTDPDRQKNLNRILSGPIQWPNVLRILHRHRIQGLAYGALGTHSDVPATVREQVSDGARRIAQQNLLASMHTARLCKVFETEGIQVAVLKGLPLCMKAYGNLGIRHSKDIDLLVSPKDAKRAADKLQELGYVRLTPRVNITPKQMERWTRHKKDFEFRHATSGNEVELHWRPFDNLHLLSNDFPIDPYRRIEIARGLSLPALSDRDLMLYLCVHGAQHAWFRLKWIVDIAALSSRLSTSELHRLMSLGKEMGVEQTVHLALLLSSLFFGAPRNATLRPATRYERFLMNISLRVLLRGEGLREPKDLPFGLTWISAFQFLLKPEPKYCLEELYRWLAFGIWAPKEVPQIRS